jgi:hypothetical protein
MDNLFNRFFDMAFPVATSLSGQWNWAPRVDVSDGKADIQGYEVEDIDVDVASILGFSKMASFPPKIA